MERNKKQKQSKTVNFPLSEIYSEHKKQTLKNKAKKKKNTERWYLKYSYK